MAFTESTRQIEQAITDALGGLLDAREEAMVAAWATTWDTVGRELEDTLLEILSTIEDGGTVTATMLNRSERLQAAVDALADSLEGIAGEAADGIVTDLRKAAAGSEVGTAAMIADQLPDPAILPQAVAAVTVVRADPAQITAMLTRSTQNVTRDMAAMPAEQAAIIRAELNRGITVGANPRETARRMVQQMEGRFNYGLTRALVVSRTETLDMHRAAAQQMEQANADLLAEWEWICHIDARTCRACIAMHGQRFPLDQPGPHDHHQGRCARGPVTKTWRELGFDIDEPEPLPLSGAASFDDLPEQKQRVILGKDYEAWQAGDYPIENWATTRQNDGWRDSIAPTKGPR